MKSPFVYSIMCLVLLASCGGTQNLLSQSKRKMNREIQTLDSVFLYKKNYEYRIRKDDKISISVWQQDELGVGSSYGIYNSNEVYGKYLMVDAQGNIEVPKIGKMYVLNFTIVELKDSLSTQFSQWLNQSIVDVKVLNKEVTILGEVRNPGVYDLDKETNHLFELIAMSGGTESYANLKYVKIIRQQDTSIHEAILDLRNQSNYLTQDIQLMPSDVVIIPSKKYKEFDRRISVIIPFTSALTAAAIFMSGFNK